MQRFGSVSLSLIIAACWLVLPAAAQTGPTFTAEEPRKDLGEIKAGTVVETTFTFHNDGTEDVRILKAKPS